MLKITIELNGSDFSPESDRTGQADMSVDHCLIFSIPIDPMRGPTLSECMNKLNAIARLVKLEITGG